jgi:glycosyltransferase involved in cell wall biosynthesis
MKISCALFTNIAPLYSKYLWYNLASSTNVDYSFYSSRKGFAGIETIDSDESRSVSENGSLNWYFIKNIYINDYLFYQSGIISNCLKTNYDVYILSGEMYIISNWLAAVVCKMRGKPLIFWGHGLYGNESYLKRKIRLLYYRIADYHLVYANRSRKLLIDSGFSPEKLYVVYNSLNYELHRKIYNNRNLNELKQLKFNLFPGKSELPVVVFIGRLTKEKKIPLLLDALSLSKKKGNEYNCLIVGDGGELDNLRLIADKLGISSSICFTGASYDETFNANLLMLAECCVSPGNVGLTAIHSLSLGTPVITHGNLCNQMPEAEAVIQEKTGLYFNENDVNDLSEVIDNMILNNRKSEMEQNCIAQIMEFWNPSKQKDVFDEAVLSV